MVRSQKHLARPPNWRITPCRLSVTAYSIYLQLPSIFEAVPPCSKSQFPLFSMQEQYQISLRRKLSLAENYCLVHVDEGKGEK